VALQQPRGDRAEGRIGGQQRDQRSPRQQQLVSLAQLAGVVGQQQLTQPGVLTGPGSGGSHQAQECLGDGRCVTVVHLR